MRSRMILWPACGLALLLAGAVAACKSKPAPTFTDLVRLEAEHLRALVSSAVNDEERAARAEVVLQRIDAGEQAFVAHVDRLADEARRLDEDYDATREDFEGLFARLDVERAALRATVLPQVVELHEILTTQEWHSVHAGMGELNAAWGDVETWTVSR